MSEAKFTKGEWVINDEGFDGLTVEVSKDDSLYMIARDVGGQIYKDQDGDYSDFSEVEANAHLIAAAPEMYEMLSDVVDRISNPDHVSDVTLECLTDDIESILSKARGESNE